MFPQGFKYSPIISLSLLTKQYLFTKGVKSHWRQLTTLYREVCNLLCNIFSTDWFGQTFLIYFHFTSVKTEQQYRILGMGNHCLWVHLKKNVSDTSCCSNSHHRHPFQQQSTATKCTKQLTSALNSKGEIKFIWYYLLPFF